MRKVAFLTLSLAIVYSCHQTTKIGKKMPVSLYPEVAKGITEDDFFGEKIADPYRWLEENNDATRAFVEAQNKVTFAHLATINNREAIRARLESLWNYERYSAPFREGQHWFFHKNNGLQNQSVMYVCDDAKGANARVLLDPNAFSKDGTVSLAGTYFSKDGRYMVYAIQDGGSDWNTFKIKDLTTMDDLPESIQWVKFSTAAWLGDGFFYSRYRDADKGDKLSKKNEYHQVYFHKLGTNQADDKLIFEDETNPTRNFGCTTSEDERITFLIGTQSTSGNSLAIRTSSESVFTPLVADFANDFELVANEGDQVFILTNEGAPNYKIMTFDAKSPQKSNWKPLLPESKEVLSSVSHLGGKLVCLYIKDASSVARIYSMKGELERELPLPGIGAVGGFSGKKGDNLAFFSFSSFNRPNTIYSYDLSKGVEPPKVHFEPKLSFNPSDFETRQVFYPSKDGTKVPMFITFKKGTKLDGTAPTLLYGYGGFNISVMPSFKIPIVHLLEKGGIYAVANIRGGGEYGRNWHEAGILLRKQNVFDDFIAAAEYLTKNGYTSPKKLAIEGRSNGGLLVGACMTQRPELFAVAYPGVGVLDMLRYHKFTIGWAWKDDYGISTDSKEMFRYLKAYSPVHNCRPANYPATMVTTADHDDRVVPAHSYKFISALQAAQKGDKPCLIRIDVRAGHGAGKPTSMVIKEEADKLAFMFEHTK